MPIQSQQGVRGLGRWVLVVVLGLGVLVGPGGVSRAAGHGPATSDGPDPFQQALRELFTLILEHNQVRQALAQTSDPTQQRALQRHLQQLEMQMQILTTTFCEMGLTMLNMWLRLALLLLPGDGSPEARQLFTTLHQRAAGACAPAR